MFKKLHLNRYSDPFLGLNIDPPNHEHFTQNFENFQLRFPRTEQVRQSFGYQILNT